MMPPLAVRRVLGPVALLVSLAAGVLLLPVLVVVAALASIRLPGHWHGVKLLAFALVGLAVETAGLAWALAYWAGTGCGLARRGDGYVAAHYRVLRRGIAVVVGAARRIFDLELQTDAVSWSPLDDGVPGSENAMIVLARHAGPGDSLLLVDTLMNRDHLRRPRFVVKDTLCLDPLADVFLRRLPARFVRSDPGPGEDVESQIADLARGLSDEDALLIFPEGGNFTQRRRRRAIDRLRDRGHAGSADAAEAMRHVLPPRPGGVNAALDAAPHADVVFVAHTGLEHVQSAGDAWREIPERKRLYLRWWFHAADEVPTGAEERVAWLYKRWAEIDRWIAEHPARDTERA